MVLDVLHGRSPLYRIEQFIEQQHRELLLGQEIDPHLFNDSTITRSLDALFAAGPSKIITQLGIRAVQVFELDMHALSYDTTSTSVWGEYRGSEEKSSPGPAITFGHSKDQRPDLKQIMTELLCVDRGVPIAGSSLDGNSSDKKSNNAMLTRISSLLAGTGWEKEPVSMSQILQWSPKRIWKLLGSCSSLVVFLQPTAPVLWR